MAKEVWISGKLSYVVIMRTHEKLPWTKVFPNTRNCGFYGKSSNIEEKQTKGLKYFASGRSTKIG